MPNPRQPLAAHEMPPFRTPYLIHRDNTQWDAQSPATAALFFVRKFDRVRVVIYEYATFGYVDLDLMGFEELWRAEPRPAAAVDGMDGFNVVEKWFPLSGGTLSEGELRLRLFRVPTNAALSAREKIVANVNKDRRRRARELEQRREEVARKRYKQSCSVM
ncbi:hypothetical protein DQ04_17561000 [Trypanosoma grayi]|uniref:hypothetical protein n=1 Tax=Trypanosoma grayi TaxID=71804 RepID=UPI0004F458DF|nr:hypothetical protein DQ04_17561000 [Trypanosoma grayi]KEG05886.1 hypothetical protein DQ04_17561000 [Trypanosoma grayi]